MGRSIISRSTLAHGLTATALALAAAFGAFAIGDGLDLPSGGILQDEQFRGLVQPGKQVVLHAPIEGIVVEIPVVEGERVKTDQVLAVMDYGIQDATVAVAEVRANATSTQLKAELQLREMQILLERVIEAAKKGAAPDWEVRQRELQRDQAKAAVDESKDEKTLAEKQLLLEKERLKRHKLLAPFDGRVIIRSVERGSTMTRQDRLISLAALDELEAHLYLPVELYSVFNGKMGQEFALQAEQPVNKSIKGKLKYIQPIIDSASRTFRCVFTIDNKDESMPAGFTVTLTDGRRMLEAVRSEQRTAAAGK